MSTTYFSTPVPIKSRHRHNRIRAGDDSNNGLKTFLQRQALKFHEGDIAKTYVLAPTDNLDKVVAFITLSVSEVSTKDTGIVCGVEGADNYSAFPALKVGRLMVCNNHRRNGLGRILMEYALAITLSMIKPVVGCRYMILDAKRDAIPFYESLGFQLLDTEVNMNQDTPVMALDLQGLD